jgi:hypothetical protein
VTVSCECVKEILVRIRCGTFIDQLVKFQLLKGYFSARGWFIVEENIALKFVISCKGVNRKLLVQEFLRFQEL